MLQPSSPLLIQDLPEPVAEHRGVRLRLLRDDLTHPELPGNKWRKLQLNLQEARRRQFGVLLTFGGAYSNHLAAVATAGRLYGFRTIGLVRGDEPTPLNPTLARCAADGMQLHFVSREAYALRHDPDWLTELKQRMRTVQGGVPYLLPEGGSNGLAVRGCANLVAELDAAHEPFDALAVACGTGGTLAGLVVGLAGRKQAVGISALKGQGDGLREDINRLTAQTAGRCYDNWQLHTGFHFGGYARYSAPLLDFINKFYQRHRVVLDPVYTGKLLFGVLDLIEQGHFPRGSTVLAIHTGGLQGWAGFAERFGAHRPDAV